MDGTFFGTSGKVYNKEFTTLDYVTQQSSWSLANSYGGHNIAVGYNAMLNHTTGGVNHYNGTGTSGFGGVNTSIGKGNVYTLSKC